MEVFVSVDMEGIAAITTIWQTTRGTDDYPRSRELMTEEASDSHADTGNLLQDRLDQRASSRSVPRRPSRWRWI